MWLAFATVGLGTAHVLVDMLVEDVDLGAIWCLSLAPKLVPLFWALDW